VSVRENINLLGNRKKNGGRPSSTKKGEKIQNYMGGFGKVRKRKGWTRAYHDGLKYVRKQRTPSCSKGDDLSGVKILTKY